MSDVKDFHAERPNPLRLAETLRGLAECWRELDAEMMRHGAGARAGKPGSRLPFDEDVFEAKRAIDGLALTYCQILMDDTQWSPVNTDTPSLLVALAMHIGHFTANENSLVAWDFSEAVDEMARKVWAVARPVGIGWIKIGDCYEDECAGKLRVRIDRDQPMDSASVALWRPMAICEADHSHVIDAKVYAKSIGREWKVA